ncbi:MAG TPA: hypothetical protein VFB37_03605 [Steroidobacteraceae bacterium]|nr:hypothetical protein [Steroidobacteraceae bacterium]
MSAVLTALYSNHETAEQVRTRLVQDGFPTDRVQLTSRQELGQADVAPAKELPEKLKQYFHQLFQNERAQRSAQRLERAVLDGGAVIAVHPRGDVETQRALALMEDSGPVEFRASDLQNQAGEHAASSGSEALSWIGKIMVAPLAPHRTSPGAGG